MKQNSLFGKLAVLTDSWFELHCGDSFMWWTDLSYLSDIRYPLSVHSAPISIVDRDLSWSFDSSCWLPYINQNPLVRQDTFAASPQ